MKEAFSRYLYDGGPVDIPHAPWPVADVLARGRDAGAAMSLAHPHHYDSDAADIVRRYKDAGLTGLEAFYGSYDAARRRALDRRSPTSSVSRAPAARTGTAPSDSTSRAASASSCRSAAPTRCSRGSARKPGNARARPGVALLGFAGWWADGSSCVSRSSAVAGTTAHAIRSP